MKTANETTILEQSFDKKGLIVIEPNDGNQENIFLIAEEKWFEKMPLSSTYSNYGQPVEEDEAGDYLELLSETAVKFCNEYFEIEDYKIGDTIAANEELELYRQLVNCMDKEDIELVRSEVLCYKFWDGHNFATVTIEADNYDPSFKRLDDEKENQILKEYFEFDEYKPFGSGCQKAIGEEFVFFTTQWQGEWQLAKAEYNTNEYE